MSLLVTIEAMVGAGATPEMILAVVRAHEAEREGKIEARRDRDAERQRRRRERMSHGVTRTERDTLPLDKENPPNPLKKLIPNPTPSPPKGGSVPTKLEFERFWLAYPRKVGKADARKAYDRAWRKLPPLEQAETLAGALDRAKAAWTDAQFIPHASTWLNGERWEDEPEPPKKTELSPFAKWQLANGRS